jgi:penicillin-binding protein 1A
MPSSRDRRPLKPHEHGARAAAHIMRRRNRRHRSLRKRRGRILVAVLILLIAIVGGAVSLGTGAALSASCDVSSLRPVSIGQNSFVYAADGSLLGSIPAEKNREPVPLSRMSPWLSKATVAVEDRRYYQHGGVDYEGIVRALWKDVSAGKALEGGSTIAQQLVRNLYTGDERTLERKLKEACLAVKLSRRHSKQYILRQYLNTVYYGNHAYGVEAASQTYFNRHASRLTLSQSALLAGLPQAPSLYDPFHNPKAALARRNDVLKAMLSTGVITRRQYRGARRAHMNLKPGRIYKDIQQPYFFTYVTEELQRVYGTQTVREGGLRVYTTIEPRLQRAARRAIKETLNYSDDPAAAIVSVEPGTGEIRAMEAVIPGNTRNQFNLAAQSARQAGSTFKSFVLAAAIEKGADPDSTYYTSAPYTCTSGPWCEDDYKAGKPWQVATYGHTYSGSISVTSATLRSDNTVYAQLTLDVGPDYVWRLAKRLGINLTQKPVASIGLGPLGVSPLEMAAAYATFASGGIYAKPTGIRKVVLPTGKVDKRWGKPQSKRALGEAVAAEVNKVLGENALYGTGAGSGDGEHPAAGKTGTTEDHADAWYVGYTRDYSTAVWMGYPNGEIPMLSVHGQAVAGATFPVPIWHTYMAAAEWKKPVREFLVPGHEVSWHPLEKHYYGYTQYIPTYTPSTTTTEETETTETPTVKPTPSPAEQTPKPGQTSGSAPPPARLPEPAGPKPAE